ncbi:MAG: hypothetical protein H0V62_09115 [Gammaproteobacteria bacterium]|nr:hypothetical protein [Gammaproteobacteria bacterium]
MAESLIPHDFEDFVLQTLDSVAQLEALLLLRDHRAEEWSADMVAARLYIRAEETLSWLERLCGNGLLTSNSGSPLLYRYQPRSTALEQTVDRLVDVYAKQLVPVTHLIHSKPRTRVQEFADAFKLRKH